MQRAAREIRGEEPGDAGSELKSRDFYKRLRGCVLGSLLYTVLRPGRGKRQDCDRAE